MALKMLHRACNRSASLEWHHPSPFRIIISNRTLFNSALPLRIAAETPQRVFAIQSRSFYRPHQPSRSWWEDDNNSSNPRSAVPPSTKIRQQDHSVETRRREEALLDQKHTARDSKGYVHFQKTTGDNNRHILVLAAVALLFGVYLLANVEKTPVTGRYRVMLFSKEREIRYGEEQFNHFLASSRNSVLPERHQFTQIVKQVGSRIASVTGNETGFKWQFVVVDSPEVNAFCLPGGKVVVFTGLIKNLHTQDQLAAVLSHEIAHALARHGGEKMTWMSVLLVLDVAIRFVVDTPRIFSYFVQFALSLPNSRKMELEADHIGLMLMSRACFRPEQAPLMYRQLEQLSGGHSEGIRQYFSTHPAHKKRIGAVNEFLPIAKQEHAIWCIRGGMQKRVERWYDDMK